MSAEVRGAFFVVTSACARDGSRRAAFMTDAMWFVWLLRSDIRNGSSPADAQAQREFISWWLLWGHSEYPAIYAWSSEHAQIAMDPVPVGNGLWCPRLLLRLYNSRHDLQQAFSLDKRDDLADYFCWYRLHGPLELAVAPSLPAACLAATEESTVCQPRRPVGGAAPRMAITLSRNKPDWIPEAVRDSSDAGELAAWYRSYGCSLIPRPTRPPKLRGRGGRSKRSFRRDGLNVIGFVSRQSGLGEDARMISAALSLAGIRHILIDASEYEARPQNARSTSVPLDERLHFAVSIYCMSPFDMASMFATNDVSQSPEEYRIGYWPWELPRFPDLWIDVYKLVDEIWTGSEFSAQAYRANCSKPVFRLPAPVTVPAVAACVLHAVGREAFVFTYPFDPNSYLARKNPIALVRAFKRAFSAKDNRCALLLRVNGRLPEGTDRRSLLGEIGRDRRITILEGTFSRDRALAMTASCDCLVSPHRAEGFGRNIAEAILLNVPVLATAFSGCMDYLEPDECLPHTLKQVEPGEYPFSEGLLWAEPDNDDMAEKMNLVRGRATGRRQS